MSLNIFFFDDYRTFLEALFEKNADVKGYRTRLAQAAQCQKSFLSQVMSGKVHLTPDHAAHIASFLGLGTEAGEHLIDLVSHARAGSPQLKKMIGARLARRKAESKKSPDQYAGSHQIDLAHHEAFYSQWYVSAIYMLLPQTQNVRDLAVRLGISEEQVRATLKKLEEIGLIERDQTGKIGNKQSYLYLRDSPFQYNFRTSWRTVGMLKQQMHDPDSSFHTWLWGVSRESASQIHRTLIDALNVAGARAVEEKRKEERLICVNFDFFSL